MLLNSHNRLILLRLIIVGGCLVFLSLMVLVAHAEEPSGNLNQLLKSYKRPGSELPEGLFLFLKKDMKFSKEEFQQLQKGQVVTKYWKTRVKQEVALFSIAWIAVPRPFFVQHYPEERMNLETAAADIWGTFSTPPEISDVQDLVLPSGDIEELAKCKVGDCKVKIPAKAVDVIRQLDPSAPGFETRANEQFQTTMVGYVQAYLQGGYSTLVEYHDKKRPVQVAKGLHELREASDYLERYIPELDQYLKEFPTSELPTVEDTFYWMQENFGDKADRPIISINHEVVYWPTDEEGGIIVASKQLYATHYYEAALGLTIIAIDPERRESGIYLMHINRSWIDVLREIPGFLAGQLFQGAHKLLHTKMTTVKQNMEALYQTK